MAFLEAENEWEHVCRIHLMMAQRWSSISVDSETLVVKSDFDHRVVNIKQIPIYFPIFRNYVHIWNGLMDTIYEKVVMRQPFW